MPSFIVHGVPPVDRPDTILELKRAIIEAARNDPHLFGKEPISVFVPADRDTLEIGEHIVVTTAGIGHRLLGARTLVALRNAVLHATKTWAREHLPKCSCVEVNLEYTHPDGTEPARWKRDALHE